MIRFVIWSIKNLSPGLGKRAIEAGNRGDVKLQKHGKRDLENRICPRTPEQHAHSLHDIRNDFRKARSNSSMCDSGNGFVRMCSAVQFEYRNTRTLDLLYCYSAPPSALDDIIDVDMSIKTTE